MLPVCVYCASSLGNSPLYAKAAASLGRSLALTHRPIVFGGGTSGLMSALSSSALENGGEVTGVVVKGFVEIGEDGRVQGEKEVGLNKGEGNRTDGEGEGDKVGKADGKKGTGEKKGKMEMKIVEGLHERKALMSSMATGGFIALPGGFGTLEEVLESTTWSQLNLVHPRRPILLLSIEGYFEPLQQMLHQGVKAGFIPEENLSLVQFLEGDESADWGKLTVKALDGWHAPIEREPETNQSEMP